MEQTPRRIAALVAARKDARAQGLDDEIAKIDAELQKIAENATTPAARSSKRPTPVQAARR